MSLAAVRIYWNLLYDKSASFRNDGRLFHFTGFWPWGAPRPFNYVLGLEDQVLDFEGEVLDLEGPILDLEDQVLDLDVQVLGLEDKVLGLEGGASSSRSETHCRFTFTPHPSVAVSFKQCSRLMFSGWPFSDLSSENYWRDWTELKCQVLGLGLECSVLGVALTRSLVPPSSPHITTAKRGNFMSPNVMIGLRVCMLQEEWEAARELFRLISSQRETSDWTNRWLPTVAAIKVWTREWISVSLIMSAIGPLLLLLLVLVTVCPNISHL